jgi:hypothetical protein
MNANMDNHVSFSALDISVDESSKYLLVATGTLHPIAGVPF